MADAPILLSIPISNFTLISSNNRPFFRRVSLNIIAHCHLRERATEQVPRENRVASFMCGGRGCTQLRSGKARHKEEGLDYRVDEERKDDFPNARGELFSQVFVLLEHRELFEEDLDEVVDEHDDEGGHKRQCHDVHVILVPPGANVLNFSAQLILQQLFPISLTEARYVSDLCFLVR